MTQMKNMFSKISQNLTKDDKGNYFLEKLRKLGVSLENESNINNESFAMSNNNRNCVNNSHNFSILDESSKINHSVYSPKRNNYNKILRPNIKDDDFYIDLSTGNRTLIESSYLNTAKQIRKNSNNNANNNNNNANNAKHTNNSINFKNLIGITPEKKQNNNNNLNQNYSNNNGQSALSFSSDETQKEKIFDYNHLNKKINEISNYNNTITMNNNNIDNTNIMNSSLYSSITENTKKNLEKDIRRTPIVINRYAENAFESNLDNNNESELQSNVSYLNSFNFNKKEMFFSKSLKSEDVVILKSDAKNKMPSTNKCIFIIDINLILFVYLFVKLSLFCFSFIQIFK